MIIWDTYVEDNMSDLYDRRLMSTSQLRRINLLWRTFEPSKKLAEFCISEAKKARSYGEVTPLEYVNLLDSIAQEKTNNTFQRYT